MAGDDDEWQPVNVKPAVAPAADDEWQPVAAPQAPPGGAEPMAPFSEGDRNVQRFVPPNLSDPDVKQAVQSRFGNVWKAFSSGGSEGWGAEPLGMSDENIAWMQKHGIFRKPGEGGASAVFQAFNEAVFYRGAQILDGAMRAPNAAYHAVGDAAISAGVPRDVVAIPEAFMGSPGDLALPHDASPTARAVAEDAGPRGDVPPVPPALAEAHDLGITGPPRSTLADGTPAEAASAAVGEPPRQAAASATPDPENVIRGPASPAVDKAGNIRLDLIETGDDAKNVIRQAADANGGDQAFAAARRGEIPLAQVESISQASGIPVEEMTTAQLRGMGRLMRNDQEVRGAIQTMIQSAEDVAAKMKQAALTDSPEDLIAFQEARMRHSTIQEQVAGLTAEWGRTGNVFQEFRETVKDAKSLGEFLKDKKGESIDDLRNMVRAGSELDPRTQLPRFLNDMRKPNAWDKYLFYWTNALISGPITHLKYLGANAAFAGYEAGVVTPIAGAIGAARTALGGAGERVYMGEGAARMWGLLAGTPDAIRAAVKAAKQNIQVPLPGEVAKNFNPVINQKPNPIGGAAGTVLGIPSRGATAIHSFFNFLGYRSEIEAQAYRAAAKEGLSPLSDDFWQRRQTLASNPSEAAMDKAIENGYHLTFISEQGEFAKALSKFAGVRVGGIQPLKLILPFTHIPGNILKAALEQTPAAFGDGKMRADLLGKNGGVARDTAMARIAGGAAISAMVANWALSDTITGYGPTDPNERAIWLRAHEPYSVRLGSNWVSYNKFGPIGDLMGLVANLVDIGPKVHESQYAEAASHIAKGTSHLLMDEVGMQGVANLIEAMEDPDRFAPRYFSSMAATNIPFSSALRQGASFTDPNLREAKTFVDGLRYAVPFARQELLPKRDAIYGTPLDNPAYHTILRTRAASADPLDMELQRLAIKPTAPEDRIAGVKLSPEMYDQYQATAGPLAHMALDATVNSPGWKDLPDYVRETAIRNVITASRRSAAAAMQAHNPGLILQGVQQRVDHITGKTHTNRPKQAPEVTLQP